MSPLRSSHPEAMGATDQDRCPLMPTYGPPKVQFVRGEGSWLWDRDGQRYLDFLSGLAVTSLGHAHPEVAEAISEAARTLLHVSNLFATAPGPRVATTLDRLLGGGGQVYFCNSGAEANEAAIKLARKWGGHGRYQIISTYGSFHGRSLATLHATGQPSKWEGFDPLPDGFRHVAWDDLDALDSAIDETVAAVLLEPIQGEGGVNPGSNEYLQGVRKICTERGILLMFDEIQTGLGRTGRWFAHQRSGVIPDVVTMAKALGNGMPVGACWAPAGIAAAFEPGDHATTFGGQPLALSAAEAVLRIMEAEDVPARAERAGERIRSLAAGLPGVVGTRGAGLLIGLALADHLDARVVANAALEAGLIVNGVTESTLRLAPSLLVSDEEIDTALEILASVLT